MAELDAGARVRAQAQAGARRLGHGADLLQLDRAAAPGRGLTSWLAEALRAGIRDGRLRAGTALPATRVLADDLGVSRGVVVEAYQRLREEGLVSGRTGAGTMVFVGGALGRAELVGGAEAAGSGEAPGLVVSPDDPLALPRRWGADAEIDLSPGVPDLSAFPRAAWLRAERAALTEASPADLGYNDSRGNEALRAALAGWLSRTRGLRTGPEAIVVTAGVAQALALMSQTLRGRGHTRIAVENPGSRGTRDELAHWGLVTVPVTVDADGLVVTELARAGVGAVAVTPAHQFPTGVVLSPDRRRELLDWAAGGGLIIEDDYDAEFRYDRAPVPALHASAPGQIAYAGSVSKTLAPGMRLGWLVPPPELYADIVRAKHASDLGAPALPQLVLARLITGGGLEQHIRQVKVRQRRRRDALLGALQVHLPEARVQGIPAGLHLLVTFPDRIGELDDSALAARLRADGVLVHALSRHRDQAGQAAPAIPGLVLGYAAHTPDQLRDAGQRIARAVRDFPWLRPF
jgi:GntR family transcriptional regulator / MocR family aminotransferase